MSQIHINIGHLFAKPYESNYSMMRRCLCANPGLTYFYIASLLNQSVHYRRNAYERLRTLQVRYKLNKYDSYPSSFVFPEPIVDIDTTSSSHYKRQCPKCAKEMYHTNIYNYSWLSRCPIHHCKLTYQCGICNQQWPTIQTVAKRDCPGCGLIPVNLLKKCTSKKKLEC